MQGLTLVGLGLTGYNGVLGPSDTPAERSLLT